MPNDLATVSAVTVRILDLEQDHNQHAEPFKWRYTREDMVRWLKKKAA